MEKSELIKWLEENKSVLSISGLEVAIGCPPTTLHKVLQKKKGLPDKWVTPLYMFVTDNLSLT